MNIILRIDVLMYVLCINYRSSVLLFIKVTKLISKMSKIFNQFLNLILINCSPSS